MAAPLGQQVFNVPKLGQQGVAIDQARAARVKKKEDKLKQKLKSTGADRVYNDNIYKLQGRFKQDADALYSKYEELGAKWMETQDPADWERLQNAQEGLKTVIYDYQTQYGVALESRRQAEAEGWVGYADDAKSYQEKMDKAFGSRPSTVGEDGRLYVIRDGKRIPYLQSPDHTNSPINPFNSVMPAKETKMGKYTLPQNFVSEYQNILIYAPEDEAVELVVSKVTDNLDENPELASDIALFYVLNTGDLKDPSNPTVQDRKRAEELFGKNPEWREKAVSSYLSGIRNQAEKGLKLRKSSGEDWEQFMNSGEQTPEATTASAQTQQATPANPNIQMENNAPKTAGIVPGWAVQNITKWEGGQSTKGSDRAKKANPDAPLNDQGERVHTNRGVQYKVYKEWAKRNGIPKKQWGESFLNMDDSTFNSILDDYAKSSGANEFNEPILSALFTQNKWGTGNAIRGSKSNSEENQANIRFIESQIGREVSKAEIEKISPKLAKEIEQAYSKDPKGFITGFRDSVETYYKTLGKNWDANGEGWMNRLNDFTSVAISQIEAENSVNLQQGTSNQQNRLNVPRKKA